MRRFDKNRRKLIKPRYIRGLIKSASGTGNLVLEDCVDAHIRSLEISGNTIQDGEPTPNTPIAIQNANDNGMKVILHGKNLATAQQVFNKTKLVEKEDRICVQDSGYYKFVLPEGFKEKTQYTVSFDVITEDNPNYTNTGSPLAFYVKYVGKETSWNNNQHTIYAGLPSAGFKRVTLTTVKNQTVESIGAWTNTDRYFVYVDINSFQFEEGTTATPYEPYFREEIYIPTEVDVNGKSVPLLFSGYDKLTVDKRNGTAEYHSGVYRKLNGQEPMGQKSGLPGVYILFSDIGYSGLSSGNGYCTHFKLGDGMSIRNDLGFGANQSGIVLYSPENFTTIDELRAYLKAQSENGTPVEILAELTSPKEYDISKTELGQALLSLSTQAGKNYISFSSDVHFNLSYYSETEEDTVDLIIKYLCGDDEIKDAKVQEIRKGSKYLIIAPHIDGYTRVSTEACGVADEDATVELIYKEN